MVLDFDDAIGGYASYGRNRVPAMNFGGEIFELYIAPEFQGLGFGKRLFSAARRDLAEHGYSSFLVWALADNEPALSFYGHLGGTLVRRALSDSAASSASASPSLSNSGMIGY